MAKKKTGEGCVCVVQRGVGVRPHQPQRYFNATAACWYVLPPARAHDHTFMHVARRRGCQLHLQLDGLRPRFVSATVAAVTAHTHRGTCHMPLFLHGPRRSLPVADAVTPFIPLHEACTSVVPHALATRAAAVSQATANVACGSGCCISVYCTHAYHRSVIRGHRVPLK